MSDEEESGEEELSSEEYQHYFDLGQAARAEHEEKSVSERTFASIGFSSNSYDPPNEPRAREAWIAGWDNNYK